MNDKFSIKKLSLIFSWCIYDLANQFFALNIVSLYFARWILVDKGAPEICYSLTYGVSVFLVAILAPLLGYIADATKSHRLFLNWFTMIAVIFTISLGFTDQVNTALLFFALANFGCQMAGVFYNSMMVYVAPRNKVGLISGLGRVFSYFGAIISVYLMKPIVLQHGNHGTFFPTGLLFLAFALPCMLFIKEETSSENVFSWFQKEKIADTIKTIRNSLMRTYRTPGLAPFLKASFFALSAVSIIILFMSVYVTQVFKLNDSQIVDLTVIGTIAAIVGSFLFGCISDYVGYRFCLFWVMIFWMTAFTVGALMTAPKLFWLVGVVVGLALGSTFSVSRAYIVRLIPQDEIGEAFGLFNFVGYASNILGAIFWGGITFFLSFYGEWKYRIALLSLNIFMVIALIYLAKIPKLKKVYE